MKIGATAREQILELLIALGMKPEKEIFPNSPVADFFNLTLGRKDGSRVGVISVLHDGKLKTFQIKLNDKMSHEALLSCLRIGLTAAMAFSSGQDVKPASTKEYSKYDEEIKLLRIKLKYFDRHLRRAQRKFHNAEGRFRKMLALHGKRKPNDNLEHTKELLKKLNKEADKRKDEFCRAYEQRQKLVSDLHRTIDAEAEGTRILENMQSDTSN